MCNMKCPFTHNEIKSVGNYLRYESKKRNVKIDELHFLIYKENYSEELRNNFKKYYEDLLYSIPDFKRQFHINNNVVYFLAKYHNIRMRTIKESATMIGKQKAQKTFHEKYGVSNPSQLEWVNDKKKKTFSEHFGVDNVWKTKNYLSKLENIFWDKYNMTISDCRSLKAKETWSNKTDDEKRRWLLNSIHSDTSQLKQLRGYNKSKLESKVEAVLSRLSITYTHTFLIKVSNRKRYFYDFYLKDYNLILEINGDYWHANPSIYKPDDLLHYRFKTVSAKEIWEKDKAKITEAMRRGYNLETIWESDAKCDSDITKKINEILHENS